MSNQKPIADNLFTWPSDQPKLLGSKDTETGRYFFPAKKSNTHEQVELSTKGKLWTWTVRGEIMVESRLEGVNPEDLEIGMEMELSIDPFVKNEDGEELMMFSFRPCKN